MIYFNGDIKNIQYSGHTISKVYSCGGNLVWSGGTTPPTPPTGDKLTYTISGNTYILACNGNSTLTKQEIILDVIAKTGHGANLETAIIGDCVTVLGSNCFNNETSLSSVTIPNTVTTIMDDAFFDCYSLSSITIPDSVTSIGEEAFANSRIESITLPNSITEIPLEAFSDCIYLNTIEIPSGVTSIGRLAFYFDHYIDEPQKTITERLARNRSVTIHALTPPALGEEPFHWSGDEELCL